MPSRSSSPLKQVVELRFRQVDPSRLYPIYAVHGSTDSKAAGHVEPTALLCRPSTKPFARAVATGLSSQSFRSCGEDAPGPIQRKHITSARRMLWFFGNAREHFEVLMPATGLTHLGSEVEHVLIVDRSVSTPILKGAGTW